MRFDKLYERFEERAIEELGELPEHYDNFQLKNSCEHFYNLGKQDNKELRELLREACKWIMRDTTTGTYDDWRCGFINKPQIKKIMEGRE